MVYIRAKKIKSDQYLYLVKSVWDAKKNTSKQEIVKYLGKSSDVVNDDLPIDYRNDPKILSVIAKYNPNTPICSLTFLMRRQELLFEIINTLYPASFTFSIHVIF